MLKGKFPICFEVKVEVASAYDWVVCFSFGEVKLKCERTE